MSVSAATLKKLEGKLKEIECAIDAMRDRLTSLENKWQETESKQAILDKSIGDKTKGAIEEIQSKVATEELKSEERFKDLEKQLQVVVDKTVAIGMKVGEVSNRWPTPEEAKAQIDNEMQNKPKNEVKETVQNTGMKETKQSFANKYKEKAKDTILLVGDSLARGVGAKLEYQSNMVSTISKSGANIEEVTKEIAKLPDREDRHLVVIVGTNQIKNDGSEKILKAFEKLIDESRVAKNNKISIVGIPRRADLTSYQNSRRIGVNLRVKEMCATAGLEYVEYEPSDDKLAKDGLHLNHLGQDDLGRIIFTHCKPFLV